jgi:hypothetical protein
MTAPERALDSRSHRRRINNLNSRTSSRIPVNCIMKLLNVTIIGFAMIFLIACNKSSETVPGRTQSSDGNTTQTAPAESIGLAATPSDAAPVATRLNPPHGQPGHRCEVAVGAPLDSPTDTQPSPFVSIFPQLTQTSSNTVPPIGSNEPFVSILPQDAKATATTPTGANPPHGEPGHRCEIPVGAPLDSPPATTP